MKDCWCFFIRSGYNWLGQSGTIDGYVKFMDVEYMCRAIVLTVMRRFRKFGYVTVGQIVEHLEFEDDSERNIALETICLQLGCFPWYIPMRCDWPVVLACLTNYHFFITSDDYKRVIDKYTIVPYLSKENRKLRLRSDFDFIRNGD